MHPTMKLRWKTSHVVKFSIDQKGNLAAIQDKVLQQLWVTVLSDGEVIHEWRDIEVAEE